MVDLRAIEVSIYDAPDDPDNSDPDHASIDLSPANWQAFEDEECTPREWWLALIDIAGILGRVAIALASDVAASARRHHCVIEYVPRWSEPLMGLGLMGCHIGGFLRAKPRPGPWLEPRPQPERASKGPAAVPRPGPRGARGHRG